MMRSVLLVAPYNSYRIHAYIEAANHLDINLVIASQSEYSLVRAVADGIQIDFSDDDLSVKRIIDADKIHHFQAVLTSDDGGVRLAAKVANALGLSANTPASAELTRRKDLARLRLKNSHVAIPGFRVVTFSEPILGQLRNIQYPVVVKPVSMSGSKGVIRADNHQQCVTAIQRIRPLLANLAEQAERESILIEDYIAGKEVAFEGLLHKGLLTELAIFDKPDLMEGPFFEESYYITPTRLGVNEQRLINQSVAVACAAYGLSEGPVHAELRLQQGKAYIIEIASRTIGGDCADMLKFGLNIGLEELILLQALGKPVAVPRLKESVGVLMIPIPSQGLLRRVEGIAAAKRVPYISKISISVREGYEVVPLPEGSSYLGFIFAKAPTAEKVEAALREAHSQLTIVIAPSFKVINA